MIAGTGTKDKRYAGQPVVLNQSLHVHRQLAKLAAESWSSTISLKSLLCVGRQWMAETGRWDLCKQHNSTANLGRYPLDDQDHTISGPHYLSREQMWYYYAHANFHLVCYQRHSWQIKHGHGHINVTWNGSWMNGANQSPHMKKLNQEPNKLWHRGFIVSYFAMQSHRNTL